MLAFRVVEKLDVIEYVSPGVCAGGVGLSPYALALEQLEKALGHRIVVAVSAAAHAGFQIVRFQEGLPP